MGKYKVYTKEKGLIKTNDYNELNHLTWHREDGPAYIRYDSIINGDILEETYYNKGILHRLDGPAFVIYDNGNIKYKEYWLNGNEYTEENYHKALLNLKVQLL